MKIADKATLTALAAVLGLGLIAAPVWAQDADASVVPGPETAEESVEAVEVPDSVKETVKNLNDATKDITLEDLNSAREAVVKLDVLIDIEKRLNDLMSLRKEREEEEESVDDLSEAIPAPAYTPAPAMEAVSMQPAPAAVSAPVASASSLDEIEVLRITGATGRYAALVKSSDGMEEQVRVGDKLSDGTTVKGISRYGVTFKSGAKRRTIEVKDVGPAFVSRK